MITTAKILLLQILRNSVASIFIKILFGFLVLSFAIWGMGDIFSGAVFRSPVAEVGSIKITTQTVNDEYQREVNQLRELNITPNRSQQIAILNNVIQNLIIRAGFDAEAIHHGLTTSDEIIAKEIRSNKVFRGNLNSFDKSKFQQVLRANGISEEFYVEELRQDITRNQMLESFFSIIQIPKIVFYFTL